MQRQGQTSGTCKPAAPRVRTAVLGRLVNRTETTDSSYLLRMTPSGFYGIEGESAPSSVRFSARDACRLHAVLSPSHADQIELTNQDGEAMAIPTEDSAALMEGIMLHRKGLAFLKPLSHARRASSSEPGRTERPGMQVQSHGSSRAPSPAGQAGGKRAHGLDEATKSCEADEAGVRVSRAGFADGSDERKQGSPGAEMEVDSPSARSEEETQDAPEGADAKAPRRSAVGKGKGKMRVGESF